MFKIGQKVVCVNNKEIRGSVGNLQENMIYTVKNFNPYDNGLILVECLSPSGFLGAYKKDRFEPLIDFANNMKAIENLLITKEIEENV